MIVAVRGLLLWIIVSGGIRRCGMEPAVPGQRFLFTVRSKVCSHYWLAINVLAFRHRYHTSGERSNSLGTQMLGGNG